MTLWHELSQEQQQLNERIFKSLHDITTVSNDDFLLLAQWLFIAEHYTIQSITNIEGGGHDVILTAPDGTHELLRLYYANPPLISIYTLQELAQASDYKKIRIYTAGEFIPSQLKVQDELPMLLDFRNGDQVIQRLEDVRRIPAWMKPQPVSKPKRRTREKIEPYYTAPQPNTIDAELRAANSTKRKPPTFMGMTSKQILIISGLMFTLALCLVAIAAYLSIFMMFPV